MAGTVIEPSISLTGTGLKFAIVASRFNASITSGLVNGARNALINHSVREDDITVIEVPGAFEIPLMLDILARKKTYDGLIALGAVIQGETKHFDYISEGAMRGIQQVMLTYSIPIGCGVLTTFTEEQAIARSRDDLHNKGREAALAALEIVQIQRTV